MFNPALMTRPSYMPKYQPDSSCVLYLEGQQDPKSSTIRDLSGKGNNGTITGATWSRLSRGLVIPRMDGTDDLINVGDKESLDFGSGSFAFCFWYNRFSDGVDYIGVISKNTASAGYVFKSEHTTLGLYLGVKGATDVGFNDFTTHTPTIVNGVYTHLVYSLSWSGSNLTLITYQNGVSLGDQTIVISGSIVNTGEFTITSAGLGSILEVPLFRAYSNSISASQVLGFYNQERHLFGV